ncbi:MAG: 23S rRNA (adenine(2030)-N(6))-methyltransferase RlmJ [Gammaproteobacteria bacterium]|nr:23S rRNA (adenine(2030)-N(6))-methyltransferase RlmJ [Gammaproteobacteria bacterium]MBU1646272.1 23S rRNA (adenine(2030)-N(6))-methyltransferase RlmJ [Gammaproteobacteria bacterium]MBU1971198.1 23S rRNA (adenine(2030)-N(6))-methyltransferase RlmJ [Gammaproteobacteria bacterium]
MLSYRHAFHAGNHADVLKHFVLVQLLRYLNQKDKPWWFIDTHAGAGAYKLDSEYAKKNAEFEGGISRLWRRPGGSPLGGHGDDAPLPAPLADYVAQVQALNPGGRLRHYPGSPLIALNLARHDDHLRLFELHSTDVQLLDQNFRDAARRVAIRQADGFAELKSVLPPQPRRGLTLIDPSYEDKQDYVRVIGALKEGIGRFATGMFMVWYPLIQLGTARQMPEKLKKLADKWLDVSLTVHAPAADGFGMHGSGLFIVNPPYTLTATLRETMPVLVDLLGQDAAATHILTTSG